jgi:hypothetical protein
MTPKVEAFLTLIHETFIKDYYITPYAKYRGIVFVYKKVRCVSGQGQF